MKTFKINNNYQIICNCENTRYGFRHLASLKDKNYNEIAKAKCCYYNRTWGSFEYETVIRQLLNKSGILTKTKQKNFLNRISGNYRKEVKKQFGAVAMVAQFGNLLCNTQVEKNDWKARMLRAGLENKGLTMPEDWNSLSEDDKETRLNNVIELLAK
jgi:hypothetical protein